MNEEVKKGFKIICLECGSEDCYFGTYGGVSKLGCGGCKQEKEED